MPSVSLRPEARPLLWQHSPRSSVSSMVKGHAGWRGVGIQRLLRSARSDKHSDTFTGAELTPGCNAPALQPFDIMLRVMHHPEAWALL